MAARQKREQPAEAKVRAPSIELLLILQNRNTSVALLSTQTYKKVRKLHGLRLLFLKKVVNLQMRKESPKAPFLAQGQSAGKSFSRFMSVPSYIRTTGIRKA